MLHGDQATRPEQSGSYTLKTPDHLEAVGAAPQRRRRVVVGHLRRYFRALRDIRGIAYDQVSRAVEVGQRGRKIGQMQGYARRGRPANVAFGPRMRQPVRLDRDRKSVV